MTDEFENDLDVDFKEEIPPDTPVCSIDFFYDGLTCLPKYRLNKVKTTEMDALTIYAMACQEIMEKYSEEIVEKVNEYVVRSPVSTKVH